MTDRELMQQALEAAYLAGFNDSAEGYNGEYPFRDYGGTPIKDRLWVARRDEYIREALAEQPAQQEPVAWMPIEQMYPQAKAIDILMGDGSILCAVLPQFDGDLWWEGSGTGEKFIDPKYANVTHWRIHDERTSPPASKPLTDEQITEHFKENVDTGSLLSFADGVRFAEAAHGITGKTK